MKKLRVSDPAERDLDDIWFYIAKKSGSIDIANRIIDSITEHFASSKRRQPECAEMRLNAVCEVFRLETTSSTTARVGDTLSSLELFTEAGTRGELTSKILTSPAWDRRVRSFWTSLLRLRPPSSA